MKNKKKTKGKQPENKKQNWVFYFFLVYCFGLFFCFIPIRKNNQNKTTNSRADMYLLFILCLLFVFVLFFLGETNEKNTQKNNI